MIIVCETIQVRYHSSSKYISLIVPVLQGRSCISFAPQQNVLVKISPNPAFLVQTVGAGLTSDILYFSFDSLLYADDTAENLLSCSNV